MNPTDYLKDVPQENYFRLADGRVIKNLEELYSSVKDFGDTIFYNHVTPDRNDFASWIRACIKNQDIYVKILSLKDRQSFLNVLGQEIEILKNPKVSETMKFFSEDYDPKKDAQSAPTPQPATQQPQVASQSIPVSEASQVTAQSNPTSQSATLVSQPVSTSVAQNTSSNSSELDFEQVLESIIQEIQEEMFFW